MIYIYSDGIHTNDSLVITIQDIFPHATIRLCTASMILSGCLQHTCDLFIMPGGADLFYCEKLNGHGNQAIRDYVHNGGAYLGICAGAYYGCATLNWNKGEISGVRELAFYKGQANGPIYEWTETPDSIYDGSWKKAVTIQTADAKAISTFYDGGPVFEDGSHDRVIARYTDLPDLPPAIVGGLFGKGHYILSSPHIERFGHRLNDGLYKHRNTSFEREKKVIEDLIPHEKEQKDFFKSILSGLLNTK